MSRLKAPFPWFGGKSRVSSLVCDRFGDVINYVEPFFGSGAVLLGRPSEPRIETVNDKDGFLVNFWRAVQHDPDVVAHYADRPVNESDLAAVHLWLKTGVDRGSLVERLEGDMDFFDAKVAGLWVWGISCWIGSAWCDDGDGPWGTDNEGRLVRGIRGTQRRMPGLKNNKGVNQNLSRGVTRARPHLSSAGQGVTRKRPNLTSSKGVVRKMPSVGGSGRGVASAIKPLYQWMTDLSDRLRKVRVICGDWGRVLGPSITTGIGVTGVFLDPPYGDDQRESVYNEESFSVAGDVLAWCKKRGSNPKMRIALCGYEGEHEELEERGWDVVSWKAGGAYKGQSDNQNRFRERIWFSPGCNRSMELF